MPPVLLNLLWTRIAEEYFILRLFNIKYKTYGHNLTITDEQGAALAKKCRIASYTDGNDLLTQCVNFVTLQSKRQILTTAIMNESSNEVLEATITAFDSVTSTPIRPVAVEEIIP